MTQIRRKIWIKVKVLKLLDCKNMQVRHKATYARPKVVIHQYYMNTIYSSM
jgi:hypothetical protein